MKNLELLQTVKDEIHRWIMDECRDLDLVDVMIMDTVANEIHDTFHKSETHGIPPNEIIIIHMMLMFRALQCFITPEKSEDKPKEKHEETIPCPVDFESTVH